MTKRQQALRFQRENFERLGDALQLVGIFTALPMVTFAIKDRQSRYVCANARTLEILKVRHEWQLIGKQDRDFYPVEISAGYVAEDQQVMRTGKMLKNYVQMVPEIGGPLCWYIVSKAPLRDAGGRICGVAVAMYEHHEVGRMPQPFQRLEPALRHLHAQCRAPIETRQLAALTHVSESQFTRLFRKFLGESPMRYLIRQRVHAACHDLIATGDTIGAIALECGFYDQSAFTRAFRAQTGQTPSAYRRRHLGKLELPQVAATR